MAESDLVVRTERMHTAQEAGKTVAIVSPDQEAHLEVGQTYEIEFDRTASDQADGDGSDRLGRQSIQITPIHSQFIEDWNAARQAVVRDSVSSMTADEADQLLSGTASLLNGASAAEDLNRLAELAKYLADSPPSELDRSAAEAKVLDAVVHATYALAGDAESEDALSNRQTVGSIATLFRDVLLSGAESDDRRTSLLARQATDSLIRYANDTSMIFAGLGANVVVDGSQPGERFGYFETGTLEIDPGLFVQLQGPAIITFAARDVLTGVAERQSNPVVSTAPVAVTRSSTGKQGRIPRAPLAWSDDGYLIYDTFVASPAPTTSFGNELTTLVRGGSVSFETFVKIDLSQAEDITSATLTLRPTAGGGTNAISVTEDSSWMESSLTWSNRPSAGPSFATWTPVANQAVTIDITHQARRARYRGDANLDGEREIGADVVALEAAIKDPALYTRRYGLSTTDAETRLRIDVNDDSTVTTADVDRFFAAQGAVQADVNLDGEYNLSDFNIVGIHYLTGTTYAEGDMTFDCRVDAAELNVIAQTAVGTQGTGPLAPELSMKISSPNSTTTTYHSTRATTVSNRPSVSITSMEFDPDNDGLINAVEQSIGTDPDDFDTDDDLLSDRFEYDNGLDPLDPDENDNGIRDDKDDFDDDGLNNLDEQIYDTDPSEEDSDGDGADDQEEADQGSDPNDASDDGIAPDDDDVVDIRLTIGDPSGSVSERYDLRVGDIRHQATEFGRVERDDYRFRKGETYEIEIIHRGTLQSYLDVWGGANYDWRAGVAPSPWESSMIITEDVSGTQTVTYDCPSWGSWTETYPNAILRRHVWCHVGAPFLAQDKTAYLHIPKVDLDLVDADGNEIPDDEETNPGGFVVLNHDDDDGDGILDYEDSHIAGGDDDFGELKLHELLPERLTELPGAIKLSFDPSKVRIWKDRSKNAEVINNSTELDISMDHSLYIEGIAASTRLRDVEIKAKYTPGPLGLGFTVKGTKAEDLVKVTVVSVDLKVENVDNDWEDTSGAIVWRNSDFSKEIKVTQGAEEIWLPDYQNGPQGAPVWDPRYEDDLTEATINWPIGLGGHYQLQFTYPDDLNVWYLAGTGQNDDARLLGTGEPFNFPEDGEMTVWIEGLESSESFATDAIRIEAVPESPGFQGGLVLHDEVNYTVVDIGIGVDGNRDGQIDFDNHDDRSLLFWYNNDQEGTYSEDPNVEAEVADVNPTSPDNTDLIINGKRDLEDFAPLRIFADSILADNAIDVALTGGAPTPGELSVEYRLKVEGSTANSALRLYRSSNNESDIQQHVKSTFRADVQANDPAFRQAVYGLVGDVQLTDIDAGNTDYLFEAWGGPDADTPQVKLVATVTYPDGSTTSREQSLQLDLRDITEFYDRYGIQYFVAGGDARYNLSFEHFPDATRTHASTVSDEPFFDGEDTIIFVHGWNMTDGQNVTATDWKKAFAETAYKRLYWQGFTGRFVAFNWPTFDNHEGPRDGWFGIDENANLTYNPSEFQAYRSGQALRKLVTDLPGDRKHLLAHSMGNVVAAEALRQSTGQLVDTYVAMEAAISSGAYGVDSLGAYNISGLLVLDGWRDQHITWDEQSSHSVSNNDLLRYWHGEDFWSGNAYMSTSKAAAAKWVNMYNPEDYATSFGWRLNNLGKYYLNQEEPAVPAYAPGAWVTRPEQYMPPTEIWTHRYVTEFTHLGAPSFYRVPYNTEGEFDQPRNTWSDLTPGIKIGDSPGPTAYEILAFMSEANAPAVGNVSLAFFDANQDIRGMFGTLDAGASASHSFQFHFDAATTVAFWEQIRFQTGFVSALGD